MLSALILVAIIVPVTGPLQAGSHRAWTDVIAPHDCKALTRPFAKQDGARCVRVVRHGCEVARGRYIDQSANRVWLLHVEPWTVFSVALEQTVMEDVSEEKRPKGSAPCPVKQVH